jgi:hypothetical protein
MPSKTKPLPLHVSRALILILREQADVIRRTQRRIALLRATENSKINDDDEDPVTVIVNVYTEALFNSSSLDRG